MRWDCGGDREPTEFERARRETVRYHEELYASVTLGQAGTWLAKPHRLMADALELVSSDKPAVAYDLGAGIGRHTIPLLRELPAGSDVFAVDLLPSALRSLENAVPPGIRTHLHTRPADLDDFEFEEVDDHGRRRPALLESAMSTADATGLLASAFGGFDMTYQRLGPAQVREDIYTLTSTLVTWLATRPEMSGETELR